MTTKIKIRVAITIFLLVMISVVGLYYPEFSWGVKYLLSSDIKESPNDLGALSKLHCPNCNLILISLDTVRADYMGFMGSVKGLTPNLDAIAKKSVVFKNASTNAFYTTPSHMTAFTCLYPQTHNIFGNYIFWNRQYKRKSAFPVSNASLSEKYQTLPEVLKTNGYSTFWFAPKTSNYFPLDQGYARGFDHMEESIIPRQAFKDIIAKDQLIKDNLLPNADSIHSPFYMFIHSFSAHAPFILSDAHAAETPLALLTEPQLINATRYTIDNFDDFFFEPDLIRSPNFAKYENDCKEPATYKSCFENLIPADRFLHSVGRIQTSDSMKNLLTKNVSLDKKDVILEQYRQSYSDGIQYLDQQVGELWKSLEKKGLLKNSVVMIFSDHGEELFEHQMLGHLSFHEEEVRIPFLIYTPNIENPIEINRPISLVDLMPMGLDLINIKSPKQCQGPVANPKLPQNYVYGYALGSDYIKDQNWKLMTFQNGSYELYYLPQDPNEQNNLLKLRLPFVANKKDFLLKQKKNLLDLLALDSP